MTDPLVLTAQVAAPVEHAFELWTSRCEFWWPRDHTVSGNAERIVFEGQQGGRIYEVAPDGTEHDWGRIVAWEPPTRLTYRWHLFLDPAQTTDIEVTFTQINDGVTAVRLEHRGWERLGDAGPPRRERTGQVWTELLERCRIAATRTG